MTEDVQKIDEGKKDYELAFMLVSEDAKQAVFDVLRGNDSTPYYESPVNQVRLAYPINKHTSAFFGFCYFLSFPENLKNIKDALSVAKSIIRFLIITPPIKSGIRQVRQLTQKPEENKPESPAPPILTNEALEQKLEEILK